MTIQNYNQFFDSEPYQSGAAFSFGTVVLDSANEATSMVFNAEKNGTIDRVGVLMAATQTGANIEYSLRQVDTNGIPSTVWSTNSTANRLFADTDDSLFTELTLGSGAVVNSGDTMAFMIRMENNSAGNVGIRSNDQWPVSQAFPYVVNFLGTTTQRAATCLVMSLMYSDSSYMKIPGLLIPAALQHTQTSYNISTAFNEFGRVIEYPFPVRVVGFWANLVSLFSNNSGSKIIIYDADSTTVLTEYTRSSNVLNVINTQRGYKTYFPNAVTLSANTKYYMTQLAVGVSAVGMQVFNLSNNLIGRAFGTGSNAYVVHRSNPGVWSINTNNFPLFGPIIEGFDDGVQTGGGGGAFPRVLIMSNATLQVGGNSQVIIT